MLANSPEYFPNYSDRTSEFGLRNLQNISLYLFLFFVNFQELKFLGIDFSIPKLTGLIYVITVLPGYGKYFKVSKIETPLLLIWVFFGFLTFISLINTQSGFYAFFDFSLFQNIILFWILINHGRRSPLVLERGMLFMAMGSVSLALLFLLNIGVQENQGRISLFGDNENIISLRLCISMCILVLAVFQNKLKLGYMRYFLLLPLPVMLKLLAETGSRVGIVAFVLCFITCVTIIKTRYIWVKTTIIGVSIIIFAIIIQFLLQYDNLIMRFMLSYEQGDTAGRDEIYSSVLNLVFQHPVVGVGQTGYAAVFGEMSPHNVLIEIAAYTGVVGLLIYLSFLFFVFKAAFLCKKRLQNILPVLLLIPILGFLLTGQILAQKLGWIVFAYIISSSIIKATESELPEQTIEPILNA